MPPTDQSLYFPNAFPPLHQLAPLERLPQHLPDVLHIHEPHARLDALRHVLLDIRSVRSGRDDRLDPRPVRRRSLLSPPRRELGYRVTLHPSSLAPPRQNFKKIF